MPQIFSITLMVLRLFGNFVAVSWAAAPRLVGNFVAINYAAAPRLFGNFVAVIWAAAPRLFGITLAVMRLFAAVIRYARYPNLKG